MSALRLRERRNATHPTLHAASAGLTWHVLIDSTGCSGAENMARDAALLSDAARTGRAYLRLYRWNPPCLSFGFHEPAQLRYDREAIERRQLAVVRRLTGGRAVWHEHEVTYAAALPADALGSLAASYRMIHLRLAAGLRALGAPVTLAPAPPTAARPGAGPCFSTAAGGEVLCMGHKLVGSAQVRRGGALLQHGSILLDGSQQLVRSLQRRCPARTGEITLRRALGRPVSFETVAAAITAAWCASGEHLVPQAWRDGPPIEPGPFANPVWTWRR